MLSIPCQEGNEVRELIQLLLFHSALPKHLFWNNLFIYICVYLCISVFVCLCIWFQFSKW